MKDPNLKLLMGVVEKLTPLLGDVVFVGGCATGLLITDTAAAGVRTTYDVDVIAEILSYTELVVFSERLESLGFARDISEGAPVCRWTLSGMKLDVMPLDETILGFSNRWYQEAMASSAQVVLSNEKTIRLITPPYFIATKFEAFRGRGKEDVYASHDLEDIITVVDGRTALLDELRMAPTEVQKYIGTRCKTLLENPRFEDALPGYLLPDEGNQGRITNLLARFRELEKLG